MIGIITIVKVNNYGAELQAFALQKKLELLGFESEIIDYIYYKNWRFKDTKASRPFVPAGLKGRLMYWIKYRLIGCFADVVLPKINGNVKKRTKCFTEFHARNTKFSKTYRSMLELYADDLEYDKYIVGSDQVWNPMASSSIEPYFLTFVPEGHRKISYASSFGVSDIDDELQERFRKLLSNIDVISVREKSGVDLVLSLIGKNAKLVADPTLLLTKKEWMPYMHQRSQIPEHYVLIYDLSDSNAVTSMAKRIGEIKKMPVLRICKRAFFVRKDDGVTNILDAGPAEFLSLIANADYVITNSFHGTAFSINFNVPFFAIVSPAKKNNSRIESLLETTGLENRLIAENADINNVDITAPDFGLANINIEKSRQDSVDFLMTNIK